MLNKRRIVIGATLLVVGILSVAAVRAYCSPERQLEALYVRFNNALKNRDAQALSSLLAPDFQEKRLDGSIRSRAEAEANYSQLAQNWISFDKQTVELDWVKVKGNDISVIANKGASGMMTDRSGAFGPKGKVHKMVTDTMDLDVWTKTPQGWKLKFRQITLAAISIDGSPLHTHDHDHEAHDHQAHD